MNVAAQHPAVRFDKVVKRYGDLTVLNSLNLDVAPGDIVSIIGPSGSGKTTVLRALLGLESIDSGVISLGGVPISHEMRRGRLVPASPRHLRRMRSQIGMCFQQFNLFPHMTALQKLHGSAGSRPWLASRRGA